MDFFALDTKLTRNCDERKRAAKEERLVTLKIAVGLAATTS